MARSIAPGQKKDYTPIYKLYGKNNRRAVYRYAYTPNGMQAYDALRLPITISNRAYRDIPLERRARFSTFGSLIGYILSFSPPENYYGFITAHGRFREGYVTRSGEIVPPDDGWRNVRSTELFSALGDPDIQEKVYAEASRIFTSVDVWELSWNETLS